ncbi:MAG TPA: TonB-dependent receptor [Xanthomonadales bacterium]|nr:TonB-dependent receptor [Xanthomonadales bacterium]
MLFWLLLAFGEPLYAQPANPAIDAWKGQNLASLLDKIRAEGFPLVYSSSLIDPSLAVLEQPVQTEFHALIEEVLQPHGLELQQLDGVYLVVRTRHPETTQPGTASLLLVIKNSNLLGRDGLLSITATPSLPAPEELLAGVYQYRGVQPGVYTLLVEAFGYHAYTRDVELVESRTQAITIELELGLAELENLSISASRYILFSNSQFYIDQRAIQALPDLGEDPIRSVHRLPGAAASGVSSRSHFRGGDHNETTIYLNGLQLLDPFHIRNYHNIFSTIDARAIAGVEAYTGGFPANYGDSMSGVLILDSQRPERPRTIELGLSVYNTSALFSGFSESGKYDWLLSARRSNLGILLNEDLGKPDYFDIFGEFSFNMSDRSRLSFNGLYADDQILVVTESDPEELEQSNSSTRNLSIWMLLENDWTANLTSATVLSYSHLENSHVAEVNDPEQLIAAVENDRDADVFALRQDWSFDTGANHLLRWGWEIEHLEAAYRYRGAAHYEGFYANYPDIENPTFSALDAAPSGYAYSLFLTDRWNFLPSTSLEAGLRWDRQTYTKPFEGDQFSPRISLLHELNSAIDLRLTWGRYYQAQAIQRLQVEDGIDHFFPAQSADHWIAGFQYRSPGDYRLRVEAYVKDYDELRPRFENLFDSLALIPELEPDRVRLDPQSARARGLEVTLEYRGEGEYNWWLNWSWSRATDLINGSDERRSWDQRNALQGGIAWERGPWEVGVAASIHSGWPITGMTLGYDPEDDEYFPVPGPRNAEQLNAFFSLDFRISRQFQVKYGQLSGFFEVTNATNRKNQCCVDYDTDETDDGTVYLDKTIDDWLPIIPAIGVLWEF